LGFFFSFLPFLSFSPRFGLSLLSLLLVIVLLEPRRDRIERERSGWRRRPQNPRAARRFFPEEEMQGASHMLLEEPLRLASVLTPAKPVSAAACSSSPFSNIHFPHSVT
jgi:hypothetical protein